MGGGILERLINEFKRIERGVIWESGTIKWYEGKHFPNFRLQLVKMSNVIIIHLIDQRKYAQNWYNNCFTESIASINIILCLIYTVHKTDTTRFRRIHIEINVYLWWHDSIKPHSPSNLFLWSKEQARGKLSFFVDSNYTSFTSKRSSINIRQIGHLLHLSQQVLKKNDPLQ